MLGAQLLEKLSADAAARNAQPHLASDAQRSAGNYQMGHAKVGGLDVTIENPAGSKRSGIGADGKPWLVQMRDHYGYVKRTVGRDSDHVDCFVVPGTAESWSGPVFVIDQKDTATGGFDEHKVVLGAATEIQARRVYARNYSKDHNGLQAIHRMTLDQFKQWLADGDTTIPFALHVALGKALYQVLNDGNLLLEILRKENDCHDPQTGEFCSTGGSGDDKEKSKHPGGVKGHIHELLATGKAFTIPELVQATGATHERVKFLLSRLQNPKYAAKAKDALIIQKEGNQYRVVGTKPALTAAEKAAFKNANTKQDVIGTNQIGPHSFSTKQDSYGNTIRGQFVTENKKLNELISGPGHDAISHGKAQELKHEVAERLGAILEDHKDWQTVIGSWSKQNGSNESYGHVGSAALASQIIEGWAHTSSDNDNRAKAMQLAARDEFNIKDATLGHMGIKSKEDEEKIWGDAARKFGMGMVSHYNVATDKYVPASISKEEIDTFKSAMRAFTRAEYENTQAWFKDKGIKEVSVFRGTKQSTLPEGEAAFTTLHGQPLSSFSSEATESAKFGPRMYMATFPISHVIGSCRTGRGCLNERELVILGHPIKVVRFNRNDRHIGLDSLGARAFGKK